jgi:hypothetical protein
MGGRRLALAAVLASALLGTGAVEAQAAIHVQVISLTSTGIFASGLSTSEGAGGSLSGDGTIAAFDSDSANLPQGNGTVYQSYVRNVATAKTRLASENNTGIAAGTDVYSPAVSASGRFVAFYGPGNGLPGANGQSQVWVHDLQSGTTRLASAGPNGAAGTSSSLYPSLSGDGRFIVFQSNAANLPFGDGIHTFAYIRDTTQGKTVLASRTQAGAPAFGFVYGQPLSSDGRLVAFSSNDTALPLGNASMTHVYLRNRSTGAVTLIDRANSGKVANGSSTDVSISGDGRFVAFDSAASNLPGGTGPGEQSYVRDLEHGKTLLVSRNSAGVPQNGTSYYPHLSGNGRYVAFEANGSNLARGDGSTDQVYVRDTQQGKTTLLSRAPNGNAANAYVDYPSISQDGRWVEFYSGATNLGGNPSQPNVFRAGPIG